MFVGKYIKRWPIHLWLWCLYHQHPRAQNGTESSGLAHWYLFSRILVPGAPRVAHSSRSVHGGRFHMDKQCPQRCQIWVCWPTPSAVDQTLGYSSLHCHHLLTCLLWQHSFLLPAHGHQILLFLCLPAPFSTLLVGLGQFRHYDMLLSPLVKCDVFLFLNQSI